MASQLGADTLVLRTSLDRASLHLSSIDLDTDAQRLVWLAQRLPELDGLQVIEALRADPATRELSVLLNSAAQVSLAEIRRADGFLSKPFTDGLLYSMIDRVLEKQTSVRTPR